MKTLTTKIVGDILPENLKDIKEDKAQMPPGICRHRLPKIDEPKTAAEKLGEILGNNVEDIIWGPDLDDLELPEELRQTQEDADIVGPYADDHVATAKSEASNAEEDTSRDFHDYEVKIIDHNLFNRPFISTSKNRVTFSMGR